MGANNTQMGANDTQISANDLQIGANDCKWHSNHSRLLLNDKFRNDDDLCLQNYS